MTSQPSSNVEVAKHRPWWFAAFLAYGLVGVAWLTPVPFRLTVAISERIFGGSIGEASVFEDVRAYHEYASRTLKGERPYRDFLVEYPIGAMPLFVLPRLAVAQPGAYRWAFAAEMWLCYGLLFCAVQRGLEQSGQPRMVPQRMLWLTLALILLGPVPFARFDAAPTLLAVAGLVAMQARRPILAGILWSTGTLVKLFPGALWIACTGSRGFAPRRRRGLVAFVATVLLGVALWLAIAGPGLLDTLRYHSARGVEIASLWGNVLVLVTWLMRAIPTQVFDHHSAQVIAPGVEWAGAAASIAPLVGLATVAWKARHDTSVLFRHAAAAIWCLAVLGKVLSPQYLIWLLPLLVLIPGRRGNVVRGIALAAGALTFVLYPLAAVALVRFDRAAVAILAIRNLLLLGLGVGLFYKGNERPDTQMTTDNQS